LIVVGANFCKQQQPTSCVNRCFLQSALILSSILVADVMKSNRIIWRVFKDCVSGDAEFSQQILTKSSNYRNSTVLAFFRQTKAEKAPIQL
jgi:hypothetical protein